MNYHARPQLIESQVKSVAESIVPELSSRAFQAEKERRVPPENIRLLQETGLLGVFRAKKWGGSELSMRAHVDAVATISRGCAATGWVLGVYHAHDYIIGHMSEQVQEEIYTTGDIQAVAAVIGPRGRAIRKADGSYVLSGFWPFASGNAASHWLLLGAEVFDEDGQSARCWRLRSPGLGRRAARRLACRGTPGHGIEFGEMLGRRGARASLRLAALDP